MAKPNLLFLYTDEQRYDTMAAYGNHVIQTPHLDRLAANSTVFEQVYVTQPVCTPSRSSLLTGLWPHGSGCVQNNIPLRPETPCLPEMLLAGEYDCAHHGKWHLGDEIFAQHGFGEWIATEDTYHNWYAPHRDQRARSPFDRFLRAVGLGPKKVSLPPGTPEEIADRFFREQIGRLPEELSRPMFLALSARRFLREHRDRPFILFVNFLEPHMPFFSCRDGQYDPAVVTLPGNFMAVPGPDHSLKAQAAAVRLAAQGFEIDPSLDAERKWRVLIARYWGMCSLVDSAVGLILETLCDLGLDENTLITFTSDHGDMMGSHGLIGKGYMYEESARVPLLIRRPGQREDRRVSGPVSHIDLLPTLLDLMGVTPPAHLPGQSLRPLVEEGGHSREDVFVEWIRDHEPGKKGGPLPSCLTGRFDLERLDASQGAYVWTVISHDQWKYNHSSVGEHELFHLARDPGERENLVRDPALSGLVADLRRRLAEWSKRTANPYPTPGL